MRSSACAILVAAAEIYQSDGPCFFCQRLQTELADYDEFQVSKALPANGIDPAFLHRDADGRAVRCGQIGLFALRDIDAKEELCCERVLPAAHAGRSGLCLFHPPKTDVLPCTPPDDYGWQAFSSIDGKEAEAEGDSTGTKAADDKASAKPQRCLCAADKCLGYLEKGESQKQALAKAKAPKVSDTRRL